SAPAGGEPSPGAGPRVLLEVEGLSKHFGGLKAVDDVTFQVAAGEVLAIVGPNGAGKSTSFQRISGDEKPEAGSIRLEGRELAGLPPEAIAALGVSRTFQTPRVFPGLSVWDSARIGVHLSLIGGDRQGRRISFAREVVWSLLRPPAFREREQQA